MSVRVVLFDLDDTLLDHGRAARHASLHFHATWRAELGVPASEFETRWQALMEEGFRRFASGELSHQAQRRFRIRGLFPQPLSNAEADARFAGYLREYEQHWQLFNDTLRCLNALAPRVRTGIITNGSAGLQGRKLERTGLKDRFECVITPGEGQLGKPHRRIFERACTALAVSHTDCVYVGDQLDTDARAARDAGLHGVWLNRRGLPAPDDVRVASDLDALLEIMADL